MNITKFSIFNHIVLCLFILITTAAVLSMPSGLKPETANEEINFPKKEYDDWLQIQQNPNLSDYEKIKSTITTLLTIVYNSWQKRTLFDFGFLFDRSDAEAVADFAYEKGFHQLWLAKWKDYGIEMLSYESKPEFRKYKNDGNKAEIEAWLEALFVFSDAPERNEHHRLCISDFELVKHKTQWVITRMRCHEPSHSVYPHDADFDKLVREIPYSIEIVETESELMKSLKRHGSPRSQERLRIMQQHPEKPHTLTLQDVKRNFKFHRIEQILLIDSRYALVKKERPGEPSWFYFFDLATGEKQILGTGFYFARLHKIKSPNWYLFHADGTISEYNAKDFPVLIECSRMEEGEKFRSEFKARYLPIHEGAELGRGSHEVIEDVKVTIQGIEISFGPMEGHEMMFYADFSDIPVTRTSYDEDKHQFIIHFMKTQISGDIPADKRRIEEQNGYIKSAYMVSDESSCKLILKLKESAKFYRGFRKSLDSGIPYVLFTFHYEEEIY